MLFFYTGAQFFLPKGNFAYIEQLPAMYAEFCQTNGTHDMLEFIEEQFFEIGFEEQDSDEPFENEAKPVPFHTPLFQTFVPFVEFSQTEIPYQEEKNTHHFTYVLTEHWVDASSVYHPPKQNGLTLSA